MRFERDLPLPKRFSQGFSTAELRGKGESRERRESHQSAWQEFGGGTGGAGGVYVGERGGFCRRARCEAGGWRGKGTFTNYCYSLAYRLYFV